MSNILKLPVRGPDFPSSGDLQEAARLLWAWAEKVQAVSEGDIAASEACFRADDIMRMAERLDEARANFDRR